MKKLLINTSSFCSRDQLDNLQSSHPDIVIDVNDQGKLTPEALVTRISEDVIGIIAGTEKYPDALLCKAKNLKVISRCGIGMDNVDLLAAKKYNIDVVNTPDAPTAAVAELTLSLMLAILRKLPANMIEAETGTWKKQMGGLLSAQTVGLIGFGRIGSAVSQLLKAFACEILVYDQIDVKADHVTQVELDELLQRSDIVSLHCPVTVQTKGLINASALAEMKPTAYLVNTARGELVDEAALLAALTQNQLQGAALDVFHQEPYAGPLAELDNVILTPHIASSAIETRLEMEKQAIDNLFKRLVLRNEIKLKEGVTS
jgi:D-3-phosphoglycerate dehydrogenase / 2-oxoglutarate reductase